MPLRRDSSTSDVPHVAIIGGGITGLSAAYYLHRTASAAGHDVRWTLIERDVRLGGKILTETIGDAFVVEGGPDSFVAQKPWAIELACDLGLGDELMGANHVPHATWVLRRGCPRPMPDGMLLIVPTKLMPFVRSPLLSPFGKLRMALDLVVPPRRDTADETLAAFIRRRFGSEALDVLAEPLLAGIHSSECERQSILATFPRLRAMEATHGGLIRGMLASRRASHHEEPALSVAKSRSAKRVEGTPAASGNLPAFAGSPFVTLRRGVGSLVEALVARLDGTVLTGRSVTRLNHDTTAAQPYTLHLDDGATVPADAVILAVPSSVAAELVAPLHPALAESLRPLRSVSTGTLTLAFRQADVARPLDGFGMIIPRGEQRPINAVTFSSAKFHHRAPDDHLLARVFVGGSRHPAALDQTNDELLATARSELRAIFGITAEPCFSRVYRWPDANPQYDLGHLERVAQIEHLCPEGLFLAGSAYRGVGIPDCIKQGKDAAEEALKLVARVTVGDSHELHECR
jgi:oxygen-dependent protoporphyrinogen oxidase